MNIGIIGLGSIGLRHAKNSRLLKYKVFGYDIDKEKSRSLSAMGGIFIKDKKEFIKKIDVGIISSPNKCHLEDMKFLINNKKHCFIEKPISHEYYQTKKIIDKANSLKLKIFVGHNLRFHPAVKKAKGWLENKKIGRILWSSLICSSYLPDWRKGQDYKQGYANESKGGGVIFDCIHEIDLANHLLGKAQIIKCSAESTKYLKLKTEDIADIWLKHEDKSRSSIHLDYITRPKLRCTKIIGEKGMIKIEISKRILKLINIDNKVIESYYFKSDSNRDYINELKSFFKCIEKKIPTPFKVEESIEILKQVLEARKLASL